MVIAGQSTAAAWALRLFLWARNSGGPLPPPVPLQPEKRVSPPQFHCTLLPARARSQTSVACADALGWSQSQDMRRSLSILKNLAGGCSILPRQVLQGGAPTPKGALIWALFSAGRAVSSWPHRRMSGANLHFPYSRLGSPTPTPDVGRQNKEAPSLLQLNRPSPLRCWESPSLRGCRP